MNIWKRACFSASVALLTGLVGPASAESLRFAHFVPPQHVLTGSIVEPLSNAVSAATNGELEILVFPSGELGAGPAEQYVRALQGIADIVWSVTGYTSSQFERTMVAELPGVVSGRNSAEVMHAALAEHLMQEFPGTQPLALWASEPNILIMRNRAVHKPEDLRGMRIRVSGAVPARIIEALGGTPVQMQAAEGYNALQNGLIDGTMTGASAVSDFRYNEVAKFYTLGASLGQPGFYLTMNKARYDGLSPEHRAALDAATGLTLAKSGENGWNDAADRVLAGLRADPGITVVDLTEDEIAAFNTITFGVRDQIIADMDRRGLNGSAVLATMLAVSE